MDQDPPHRARALEPMGLGKAALGLATLGAALGAALVAAGCAAALTEAPPLEVIAGAPPPPRTEAAALLDHAAGLFGTREVPAVRAAATEALRAAAADPGSEAAVVLAVRALVWLSDHEAAAPDRESAATRAVQAAQWCGHGSPPSPACRFWLGAALGVQARERPTTGASALKEIEAAFTDAAAADPTLEDAGPDRALALLYLRAPGWPAGPGDPERGLEHARKAIALRPDHAPNLLALAEALAANGDAAGSRARLGEALESARHAAAAGDPDAPEWIEETEVAIAKVDRP